VSTVQTGQARFRTTGATLVRAAAVTELPLPPLPDLTLSGAGAAAGWVVWLRRVWSVADARDAIEHASPVLAARIEALLVAQGPGDRETRRVTLAVLRYLIRLTGRPTPHGLFAGTVAARFAAHPALRCGSEHVAVAGADGGWLDELIRAMESQPAVLDALLVVANTTVTMRGGRLVVPYQSSPDTHGRDRVVDVTLRATRPVRTAIEEARSPVVFGDLRAKILAEDGRGSAAEVTTLLTTLVARRVLITSLHAPSTEPDALGHLVRALNSAGPTIPAGTLREAHELLRRHRHEPPAARRALRTRAAAAMHRLAPVGRRHPVTVDLRLDADITLPDAVAREAERAALLLARLTPRPAGTAVWADYHLRFYQRFGPGTHVPLLDAVADHGVGWPDGYPGAALAAPRHAPTRRDDTLLTLAQSAALDGVREVVLDDALIDTLDQGDQTPVRLPPHLELRARLDAPDLDALRDGRFHLAVTSVSRAAAVASGRFLPLLDPPDRRRLTGALTDRDDALPAQLSFPPLDPTTSHVTRTVRVLPVVISLAEHRDPAAADVLTPADLAVSCDSDRLYLTAPDLGVRVDAHSTHALNLRHHTPPLARFLIELTSAHHGQVTELDWGAAARLPFLPRLRYGRIVLSPARWRLSAAELPGRDVAWPVWDHALESWRARRRMPHRILLVDQDRRLPLDLDAQAHRVLLREHLATASHAVIEEAPDDDAAAWFHGRAHDIVVPLTTAPSSVRRPAGSSVTPPRPTPRRVVRAGEHGQTPGASTLLFVKLYGDPQRQDVVLAEHLPALLAAWGTSEPRWWFLRFQEGREHYLRLRIALPTAEPEVFGEATGRVAGWADRLRRDGLLREIAIATSYPDTGRWGSGAAYVGAQAVFAADSRAVLTQLAQPARPHHHVLAAANLTALAVGFTGGVDLAARWLLDHTPASPPSPIPRPVFTAAQRLADPDGDFRALRAAAGGAAVTAPWGAREQALIRYRSYFTSADTTGPDSAGTRTDAQRISTPLTGGERTRPVKPDTEGVDPDAVLGSLLHGHFLRARGVDAQDKAVCLYLARVAALSHLARASGPR